MKRQLTEVLAVLLSVPIFVQGARVSVIRLPGSERATEDKPETGVAQPTQSEDRHMSYNGRAFGGENVLRSRERPQVLQLAERPAERVRVVRQPGTPAPQFHNQVVGNRAITRSIARHERVEVVPNRRYWHTVDGLRYSHYYRGGIHWYGFYAGPRFYWTRYYGNRWWWRDPFYDRWAFWASGYWWWPGPGGALYVYVNDGYYPYQPSVVSVPPPSEIPVPPQDSGTPPEETEKVAAPEVGHSWTSPDNRRQVQLVGPNGEAFLYDNTAKTPVFMKFLAKDVENVRFTGGSAGKPLQILVDFKNGGFALYDADGNTK